ncbi:hypothetical protein ASG22_11630 [Chryseobacterium sp. Leaf405]|uniref:hypothetical protein n=1 Tax=Chryseobacterium sp. Leaf405 TaxID=1736367 RepID=UPI0007012047|nr:hypothetical protein [Chryseobacterium sp. Leaf405]KQT24637.1 hypothetical protein ASG22_11630 [Chryseobacterium sp. Leaf405]
MKNILILIFCSIINNSFAQKTSENIGKLSGIWTGTIEEHPIKFEISQNKMNSIVFSFTNFLNEKFIVQKSDVATNEKNEFVISIKEAKFSHPNFEKCIYTQGLLTISDVTQNDVKLNLKSVGPKCFLSYDVIMNMPDINNLKLTKEK